MTLLKKDYSGISCLHYGASYSKYSRRGSCEKTRHLREKTKHICQLAFYR